MARDLKRKITAPPDQVFPECEAHFSTIFGKSALAVLKQYPTAEKLVTYGGLNPRVKQSEETKVDDTYMSKRDSQYLRRA